VKSKTLAKNSVDGNGYVAFMNSSLSCDELKEVQRSFYRGEYNSKLLRLSTIHLEIKCPIYVRLAFGEHDLSTLTQQTNRLEAFIPSIDMINSGNTTTDAEIQESIQQNTEALLISPKGYRMDGCDTFIANTILPISVYNTTIVTGSLFDWLEFCDKQAPSNIKPYLETIHKVLSVEFGYYVEKRN